MLYRYFTPLFFKIFFKIKSSYIYTKILYILKRFYEVYVMLLIFYVKASIAIFIVIIPLIIMFYYFGGYKDHYEVLQYIYFLQFFCNDSENLYWYFCNHNLFFILYKLWFIKGSTINVLNDFIFLKSSVSYSDSIFSLDFFLSNITPVEFYNGLFDVIFKPYESILKKLEELLKLVDNSVFNIEFWKNLISTVYTYIIQQDAPLFIYFWILFILTTTVSLILTSYLGLYGVFFINLISIILLFLSMILYID